MRRVLWSMGVGLSLCVLAACGLDGKECAPGRTVACVCATGGAGAQACLSTGRAFGPCVCTSAMSRTRKRGAVVKKAREDAGKTGDRVLGARAGSKVPGSETNQVPMADPMKESLEDLTGDTELPEHTNAGGDAFSQKIAVAMSGTGSEFVMGHGAGGLGLRGTGGGDGGYGRIHGLGKIDTGGGAGVRAGLGKARTRRVGKLKGRSGKSTGFCKKNNIKDVVRRRAGPIRACYEKRLQEQPSLAGKLQARWTIMASGAVSGVSMGGSLKDGEVKNCVARVIRRMRFAKPEGGICVVQWPFIFTSGG